MLGPEREGELSATGSSKVAWDRQGLQEANNEDDESSGREVKEMEESRQGSRAVANRLVN